MIVETHYNKKISNIQQKKRKKKTNKPYEYRAQRSRTSTHVQRIIFDESMRNLKYFRIQNEMVFVRT